MNKTSGGDRIPAELFQILKDDAVKVLHFAHMPANLENSGEITGLEKIHFHSNPKESQCQTMFKLLHNCTHLTHQQSNAQNSPSQASQYMNCELPDVQAGVRKGRVPDIKLPTFVGSQKKQEFQKNIYFCFIDYTKAFDCVDHNCGKFFKRSEYQTT